MAETNKTAEKKAEQKAPPAENNPYKLTLREKLVELRKACPKITKDTTSQYVSYKYNKIDDVWAKITPVMNAIGVDFDIVEERATKHSANNDPIFWQEIEVTTNKGKRLMFIYECDLKIKWINLDNEDDVIETVVHALGWNDDPAKAKGCAHTYALKYYLFEKFSIDQGEDDPDNFDRSATGKATPPRLSNAQMQRLYKKGDLCGMDAAAVNARILQKYNKQDPAAITIDEYNAICASLDNYYAQMTAANNQGGNQQC